MRYLNVEKNKFMSNITPVLAQNILYYLNPTAGHLKVSPKSTLRSSKLKVSPKQTQMSKVARDLKVENN